MTATQAFLLAMLIIFTAPYLVWRLAKTDYYAPLVIVQIIAGLLLGPGILGAAFPAYYKAVFSGPTLASLNAIGAWAVMLFIWVAGIELDLKRLWNHKREAATTAALALGAPLALGCIAAIGMLSFGQGWIGPKGAPWQVVLGLGMACAVTALPILVLLMGKLDILGQALGQRILTFASLDDVAIWAVLAVIILDWSRIGLQAAFLAGFGLAAIGVRRLMRWAPGQDRWYIGLIWLAACGFAADWAGLHFMVGAFLSGAVLDADLFERGQLDFFRNLVLLALMPVFFLSTGLRTVWHGGGAALFAAAGALLVASVGGKLAGVKLAGTLLGWPKGEASIVGWLLQTKGLVMIIFVNILLDKGIITNAAFTATLLMAVASTMLTTPMVVPLLRRWGHPLSRAANAP